MVVLKFAIKSQCIVCDVTLLTCLTLFSIWQIGELRSGSPRLVELNDFIRHLHKKGMLEVLSFGEVIGVGWLFLLEVIECIWVHAHMHLEFRMINTIVSQTKVTPIVEGYGGWAFRMEVVPIESAYPGFGELVVSYPFHVSLQHYSILLVHSIYYMAYADLKLHGGFVWSNI